MTGASRSAGVGPLLAVGATTLIFAALTLRNARRSVELAEFRAEHLRREQSRLVALLREEREAMKEEMAQERERHLLDAERQQKRSGRELSLARREYERLAEELRRERAKHLEAQQKARQESAKHLEAKQRALREREGRERERRARLETEQKIEHLQREMQKLREVHRDVHREDPPLVPAGLPEARAQMHREPAEQEQPPVRQPPVRRVPEIAAQMSPTSPTRAAQKATGAPPRDKKPGRAVWHPHPDDGGGGGGSAPAARARSGDPVEMYRKHYDKYLENYRGYVELAEELYRKRKDGGVADGTVGGREWEERLRRVRDGIDRTKARLDILQQHNPEMVTDARISHRASVARRHAQLGR